MTVEAISNLSGVSKATVSRVLNGHPGVQPDKVRAVQRAADKLNYHMPARKKRASRKVQTIAMLSVEQDIFAFFKSTGSYVFRGIEKGVADHGVNFILGRATSIESLPTFIRSGQVDGLILSGMRIDPQVMAKIEHLPRVWISSHWSENGCQVLPGNERICSIVVDHMLRQNHKHVGFVNIFKNHPVLAARAEFFEFTASRQGLDTHVFLSDTKLDNAQVESMEAWQLLEHAMEEQIKKLLMTSPKITSLFLPMSALVALVYRVLNRLGVRPGIDIQVVSCGSIEEAMEIYPRPAIVDIAPFLMGQRAVQMLLDQIANPVDDRAVHLVVEPKLIDAEIVNPG
jgi:DNA-binding LacI/PurR family transcriptional regulator